MIDALRRQWIDGDAGLSRFQPLERVLCVDQFDTGQHGWAAYFPDYDGWEDYEGRYPYVEPLKQILERTQEGSIANRVDRKAPIGPRAIPQLSALPMWDVGSGGSAGGYALKVATLPYAGAQAVAKKRLNSRWNAKFRVEAYFAFTSDVAGRNPETGFRLGTEDVRSISLSFDVHDVSRVAETGRAPRRWWPGARYLNADEEGRPVRRWQLMLRGSWGTMDGPWDFIEEGFQDLAQGRAVTAVHWHYLRFTFDLSTYRYVDLCCDGKEFPVAGLTHVFDPPLVGWRASTDKAHGLVFPTFGVQTNVAKRCRLYLDSIVISASEG